MINRRTLLRRGALATTAGLLLPKIVLADDHGAALEAMHSSDLIYVSPIKSDGGESRCQAEVWFQEYEGAMYVVTGASAWRAEAVRVGLRSAHVWVGDVGLWQRSDGRYRNLPMLRTDASYATDSAVHKAVLAAMGEKYAAEWGTWGPRFHNGLADGSRVMLKYQPV